MSFHNTSYHDEQAQWQASENLGSTSRFEKVASQEQGQSTISPFLGLWAKLSQAFASYPVVFLLISAYQLFRTRESVATMVTTTKQTLASECSGLEKSLSTLASFPHFAAQGVNHGLVTALDTAISQIGYGLEIVLSGFLSTVELVLTFLTGTWRCFLSNLAESGIPVISEVGSGGLQAIDQLNNIILNVLTLPFNELEATIQQRMADPQIGLQVYIPVMPMQQIQICDKALDLVQMDDLTRDFQQWILYGTLILLVMAVLATLGNMGLIWFHHFRWQVHIDRVMRLIEGFRVPQTIEQKARPLQGRDQSDSRIYAQRVSHMARHPLLFRILDWSSRRLFPKDEDKRNLYFWFAYYIARPEAVVCLLIGLLGLALIYGQIALIEYARKHWRPLLSATLTDLSDKVFDLVNGAIHSSSAAFATQTNDALALVESELNTDVFGEIVQAAAEMNTALTSVQTMLIQGIQAVFGSTLFGKLVIAVLQCLLFNKLIVIESGLTWVQENARISLPRLKDDVLMMNQTLVNQLVMDALLTDTPATRTSPGATASVTDSDGILQHKTQAVEDAIGSVFSEYERRLRGELPVFYGLVLVWIVVAVQGAIAAVAVSARQKRKREMK